MIYDYLLAKLGVQVSTIALRSKRKKDRLPLVSRCSAALEFLLVCAASIAISIAHLSLFSGPNLALLFDGFGFLVTASGCMSVFNQDTFLQILAYCAGGFDETVRLSLVEKLHPAEGIVRTGPLLPLLLGLAYTIAGKAPVAQNWAVATWSMWLTQALSIGSIWLACRLAFGSSVARIAALLAVFYPAFVINGNRIYSESQACLAITVAVMLFLYYAKSEFRPTQRFASGLLAGLVLGFLALARPPFLLLPVLFVVTLALLAIGLKQKNPFKLKWFVGVVCGGVFLLAPWALCNKILTGKPSITIDRFAVYNLYTGLNASTQGFDVLPGEFVEHPGRFKKAPLDALSELSRNALDNPADFITMAVLKPARLLDSPWNDYQASCLGVPWLLQRYFHQLILLLGLVGLSALWERGLKEKTLTALTGPVVLTLAVAYNGVHCLFISMSRYTYSVMPIVIMLAGYGALFVYNARRRRRLLLALLLSPALSLLIESTRLPPYAVMPEIALRMSANTFGVVFSLLIAAAYLFFIHALVSRFENIAGAHQQFHRITACLAAFLIAISACYGLRQIAYPLSINNRIKAQVPVPESQPRSRTSWFVVIDPNLSGSFSLDAMQSIKLAVNGVRIDSPIYPFIGADRSQRDSFVYEKAFAHSGQKDITEIAQWYCAPVPRELIKTGLDNTIEVWKDSASGSNPHLMCDLLDSSQESQTVSLINFSWSKGFSINPPLDMRLFVHAGSDPEVPNQQQSTMVRPRLSLLCVDGEKPYLESTAAIATIAFPDSPLSRRAQRMVSLSVPPEKLAPVLTGIENGAGDAIRFKVSGVVQGDSNRSQASIALITGYRDDAGARETMSPLAPELIRCGAGGKSFTFEDIIPMTVSANGGCSVSARLVASGKPWWDVLQYGAYKVDTPVVVKNLAVSASVTSLPDFSRQNWRQYRCKPIQPQN